MVVMMMMMVVVVVVVVVGVMMMCWRLHKRSQTDSTATTPNE